jgi:hypothetical protein
MSDTYTTTRLSRFQLPALGVGLLALVAAIVVAFMGGEAGQQQFFRAYLFAWIAIVGLAIGSLAILCIQYLSGGDWGVLLRRNMEAGAKTLPLVALAFIPIGLGMHELYEWSHASVVASDPILQWKRPFLNPQMFWGFSLAFLIIWSAIGWYLTKLARDYEDSGSPWIALRMRQVSAATLLFLGLSMTIASTHWIMSLEPHWFSTMYGISFIVGALLISHAFNVLVLTANREEGILPRITTRIHYRDVGNLMLAFVMLWAYTAFCQWLLIWYGNLREEIPWYIRRSTGGWLYIGAALLIFHFFVPFFALLNRPVKENPRILAGVMVYLIFMRFVDLYWLIMPAFHADGIHFSILDVLLPVALLGLWIAAYLTFLRKRNLLPTYEPFVQEALTHG